MKETLTAVIGIGVGLLIVALVATHFLPCLVIGGGIWLAWNFN
jgi:hypothetical protein